MQSRHGSFFFPIYLSMGVLGLSLGLTLPLLSLSMEAAGASASVVGTSTLFQALASFLASMVSPAAIFVIGNKRLLAASLLLCGITIGLYAAAADIPSFFIFRIFNGFALGFIFVATEATLIAESPPEKRSRIMGIYMISLSAGAAVGPMIGFPLFGIGEHLPYILAALICGVSLGAVLFLVPASSIPKRPTGAAFPIMLILIPLGSSFLFGFVLEGTLSLIALYLKDVGLRSFQMGMVVTSFDLGGIVLLYPLMKFADRFGKLRFIALASFVCGVFFFLVPSFPFFIMLALLTFISGGAVNAIYPVGMAIVGDELSEPHYPRAASLLSAAFYAGAILGPFCLSQAMDRLGYAYLFYAAGAMIFLFTALPISQLLGKRQ
ncbi:MAG: MFS transporter [Deltaproteobacteria bacterium]|nr:MFS transporter [Candidatus Zymogenaceae bacterium]